MMRCEDCSYYWKEDDERYAGCHFFSKAPWDVPPCEREENDEPDDYPEYEDDQK